MQLFNFCSLGLSFSTFGLLQTICSVEKGTTKCLSLWVICRFCNYCRLLELTSFFLNTRVKRKQMKGGFQRKKRNIPLLLWMGKIKVLCICPAVHTSHSVVIEKERLNQETPFQCGMFTLTNENCPGGRLEEMGCPWREVAHFYWELMNKHPHLIVMWIRIISCKILQNLT